MMQPGQQQRRAFVLDANSLATYQLSGTIAYGEHAEGTYAGSGSYGWSVFSYNEQAISLQTTDEQSTDSLTPAAAAAARRPSAQRRHASGTFAAPGTGSNSLSCVQYANLSFHEVGSYTNGTWNLSCWVLDATTSLNATATPEPDRHVEHSGSSGGGSYSASGTSASTR